MAKLNRRSISRRTVEALKVEKDKVFWDRDLPGFGIRVYASGTKMYVVQSRTKGKSVRVTVGRHGVISADEARRRAARIVNRIKAGEDPVPEPLPARLAGGPTVAGLAARYMEKHVAVRCKQSTAEGIRGLLGKYILPEFSVIDALTDLFILRGPPAFIRSDNGPEFVAEAVREWITAVGAQTAYIEPGSPWENGYCESFNARFRDVNRPQFAGGSKVSMDGAYGKK